jgi:hypothetical protein
MNYDWKPFLTRWSQELITSESIDLAWYNVPIELIASGWLGFPGATDSQIAAAESRIGRSLPPSYREFLKVTNGWWTTGNCCVQKWWSTEEIGWHYDRNPFWADAWLEGEERGGGPISDEVYFVYGKRQQPMIRGQYLKASLEISNMYMSEGSVYLLNPEVVSEHGEWEAWFYADWMAGAQRYRSFWDLMQGEYAKFQWWEAHEAKRYKSGELATLPGKIPALVEELKDKIQQYTEARLNVLHDTSEFTDNDKGVIDGLESIADEVSVLGEQTSDPQDLLLKLRALVELTEQQQQSLQGMTGSPPSYDVNFKFDIERNPKAFYDYGRGDGFRQAVVILRWFLNES